MNSSIKIKVVHITTVPETLAFLSGQPIYLKDHGFIVHAITSPGVIWTNPAVENEFETIIRVSITRNYTPIKDIKSLIRLIFVLKELKPTIVDAHTPKAGLLGMLASMIIRIPIRIYHIHGFPFQTSSGFIRKILIQIERIACYCSTQTICVSPSLVKLAIDENICQSSKIKIIGSGSINGIDLNRFNPQKFVDSESNELRVKLSIPHKVLIVGFVGRLVKDKGIEELAAAWECIKKNKYDAHLILIGPLESRNTILSETQNYILKEPSIHIIPQTSDIPRYYSIMDILVLPSHREGLGYVALEAAAMQIPVIITSVTGCIDAIESNVTGTFVLPKRPLEIAEAIMKYLDNPDLRKKHGAAGRKFVTKKFSQNNIWEATLSEYCRLIALNKK